jgi:hypothetical protein
MITSFEVMEIEQLRQEINDLLENVVEHSSRYTGERHIPSLEVSFVLTKINKLQESLAVLKYLLEEQENQVKEDYKKEKQNAKMHEEPKREERFEPQEEPLVQEEPLPKVEKTVESENENTAITNENIGQFPIAKLVDALTLNDRYLFANELFNKDMNEFNELVKSIDNCSSFNEAKSLYIKMEWDAEDEHVISFINLIERRFL